MSSSSSYSAARSILSVRRRCVKHTSPATTVAKPAIRDGPQCCHCGWRGSHATTCLFYNPATCRCSTPIPTYDTHGAAQYDEPHSAGQACKDFSFEELTKAWNAQVELQSRNIIDYNKRIYYKLPKELAANHKKKTSHSQDRPKRLTTRSAACTIPPPGLSLSPIITTMMSTLRPIHSGHPNNTSNRRPQSAAMGDQ
ncbi:hypothetical protein MKEN_01469700 [Mycena kentingensis (nom. inval.)]|nr:hypothetical protein MKEN_01469700 [Mycena kentingensis (nom. inval.)]